MVFTVDSANPNIENFNQIWKEMQEIQIGASVPCVVAANKQDLPDAKSVEEIRELLGLNGYPIIPISAKTGEGMMRPLLLLLIMNILRSSPMLRIVERIGTEKNAMEQISEIIELGRYKTKLRLYWLEWRGLIEADWNTERFKVVPAVKKIFEILPNLIRSYEEKIESSNVIVEVDKLTKIEKGHILYNHIKTSLFFENYNEKIIRYLITLKFEIINHPNYSPEIIRELCKIIIPKLIQDISYDKFNKQILSFIEKPHKSWIKDFNSLTEEEKIFLITLFSIRMNSEQDYFEKKYKN